ncbi:PREDICTED: BOLA class I histocompatibility antigen, alpha chain BL3-7-like [Gekko japonicus]|uniref:BOLA class I histocompatibility antigen, alpha chain BL3-7-like n=1 Tax=Gekko japonicus TaxID=146911 RepID=A0ABM1L8E5_GEKJA|nr:PREDICTED: BOLA class I histocompatibility antigen, alpha chain BL3-7-like [Gekko japonicus]
MGSLEWRLLPLGAIFFLLLPRRADFSPSHSLRYFDMAVWEPGWRVPQFTALVYMNDQLIGRYDRNIDECVPQSPWIEEIHKDDTHFWLRNTGGNFAITLLTDMMMLKDRYNRSRGIQTLQVIFGCELSGDNPTPRGFVKYGYNGKDFLSLEHEMLTWTAMETEAKPIKREWEADESRRKFWTFFLEEICMEGLRTHLRYGEVDLLKKEPPTVKVTRKAGNDGLETLVCWLGGFYPKEIDITWQKDGEDRTPDTLTGGVVPNADGTYHTWLSIEVEAEERGRYRCHVEHDGLQEPLDLAWEEPSERQPASSVSDLGFTGRGLVGVTIGAILLGATVLF